ncbi:maleylpyruvate isomerase family mycothiol-dependent enzyme [Actinomadura sp. GC306]|uniref:maleylpyruvate isomerase family mycothiol-dependent enzyme n=1 Tax=Actinomadura sp. GC306 TaxID=2530367 RepID=UPI00104B8430|nr:maleylpyruvate isomerase family mycothiol-dependent enzyme [Actinomadura sp. GC306]TDC67797.1 maleylpyruvate isomerase family mycothiol-dependent enzyme [Actinomadura sp. GC306]
MGQMRAYTAAFEQTVRSVLDLAGTFDAADWRRPTECPGWTVKDQFSHLVGIELELLGEPGPELDVPEFEHIRNEFGRSLEKAVHVRRPVPGPAVAAELAGALERRLAQLPGIDPEQTVWLPEGREGTYAELMRVRAMDCWTHEQDVRRAVGRPGNLDSPAAQCFWEVLSRALPLIVARRAKAEPGRTVAFDITGPPDFHVAVQVGEDGRGRWADDPADADVRLAMDWETYARLAAGRCTPDAVTVHSTGDPDLADRVLTNMGVTP